MVRIVPKQRFSIIYAPLVREHLRSIDRKYYALIRKVIETQLQFEPDAETRNRKPLKRHMMLGAEWELRFGPGNCFRVFYEIDRKRAEVHILAIGVKKGNRLWIGREGVEI